MKLPSSILPAQGWSLYSPLRFWQRLTKISAFLKAGSSLGTPAAVSASRKNCVLDRSGRELLS